MRPIGMGRRSGRQAEATLVPPGAEHGPASTGRHPVAEPVPAGPLSVVRLERALHVVPPGPCGPRGARRAAGAPPARVVSYSLTRAHLPADATNGGAPGAPGPNGRAPVGPGAIRCLEAGPQHLRDDPQVNSGNHRSPG